MLASTRGAKQLARQLRRGPRRQRVGRDPVGAAAEDLAAVDAEGKARAGLVRVGQQLEPAQPDAAADRVAVAGDFERVERLRAGAGRPPELRVLDGEALGVDASRRRRSRPRPAALGRRSGSSAARRRRSRPNSVTATSTDTEPSSLWCCAVCTCSMRACRSGFSAMRAIDAERGDRQVPVPAEMAGRLAQHVAVGDRASSAPHRGSGRAGASASSAATRVAERIRMAIVLRPWRSAAVTSGR